ncbi:mRNA cap guanine-N7 methyltransferase [Anopheles ziemanni]|uniref:mRNA cap guanine-N7 methyltransferase n=1 Tax=Anopheles coustani TaxID=139045 RepID=UPI002658F528|nr:mRNA cap guanine-N7 methyltransferase [Anopheles coustani]XP_058172835.1 mRNA cap guanine-N7 methyltransferase [Anopheles ziemanni]
MSDSEDSKSSAAEKSVSDENPSAKSSTADGDHGEKHSAVVASHYNKIEDRGLLARKRSNIIFLRNFNNWIKSVVIVKYTGLVKDRTPLGSPFRVLDLCCGKGGDLCKWINANVTHLICTDIAQVSLEQCESRFNSMFSPDREMQRRPKVEFFAADATLQQLRTKYMDPSMKLHLVSCQFAFHYSFESFKQADCMMKNAAECLEEGFYFIGTMPDAYEIMKRQRMAMSESFGNDIYNIKFLCDTDNPPLFGAKYNFQLDEVVDCPEFLVHFPTFEKLALKHGLRLVEKRRFEDIFEEFRVPKQGLLEKMQALETYPPYHGRNNFEGQRKDPEQYAHVEDFAKEMSSEQNFRAGTLSLKEWEAASLYLFFAFQKMKTSYDAQGRPVYS